MESPTPNPFLLERKIIERIKLLKEAVEKATREEEQEVKDQAKKSQATLDESTTDSSSKDGLNESTTDSSSKNGLNESENDPDVPIETAQEASPSLTEQTYEAHMEELCGHQLTCKASREERYRDKESRLHTETQSESKGCYTKVNRLSKRAN
ncbi:hypothetical protein BASA60_010745 [Batrachochytrium salamandrivorans]|nr:hypothetical protein BASA60_010745 [Batrachochytrium salamandrivorans]